MNQRIKTGIWLATLVLYLLFCSISWQVLPAPGVFMSPNEGFWNNAVPLFNVEEVVSDAPIIEPVEVVFDDRSVPHVFGSTIEDITFALGYLHARDRYFQMDYTYRAATGRLSEILGSRAISYDLEMRRKGMSEMAENISGFWGREKAHYKTHIEPYINGVNYYLENLKRRDYPIELKLLDYQPEKWDIYKMASIIGFLNHQLTLRHEDLAATTTLEMLGEEKFELLFPPFFEDVPPVIPDRLNEVNALKSSFHLQDADQGLNWDKSEGRMGNNSQSSFFRGSNNWVISPGRTQDSSLFLANDPHLPLTLPSIWYECHLVGPEINQYGFGIPGLPVIYVGMTEHFAIGTTNVGMDYVDYYEITWADEDKSYYEVDGENHEIGWRVEKINVRGSATVYDSIPTTLFGHMPFYDDPVHPLQNYAMYWRAIQPKGDQLKALVKSQSVENIDQLRPALQHLSDPPQNIVYGDKKGDIGLFVTGSIPARKDYRDGLFLRDGSSIENFSDKRIPPDSMPGSINPESGFVASANQITTGPDFPYPMLGNFNLDRGTYLFHYLDSIEIITLETMMALQNDNKSQKAIEICAILLPLLDTVGFSREEKEWYGKLSVWNHSFEAESQEAVLLKIWVEEWLDNMWGEIFPGLETIRPNWKSSIQLIEQIQSGSVTRATEDIPLTHIESAINSGFRTALEDFLSWRETAEGPHYWAEYRNSSIRHIARIDAFGKPFLKVGGTHSSLNSQFNSHGPSMRMIARFNNGQRELYTSLPGGRSGNPGSPYYDNGIEDWLNSEYKKVYLGTEPDSIRNNATGTLYFEN